MGGVTRRAGHLEQQRRPPVDRATTDFVARHLGQQVGLASAGRFVNLGLCVRQRTVERKDFAMPDQDLCAHVDVVHSHGNGGLIRPLHERRERECGRQAGSGCDGRGGRRSPRVTRA